MIHAKFNACTCLGNEIHGLGKYIHIRTIYIPCRKNTFFTFHYAIRVKYVVEAVSWRIRNTNGNAVQTNYFSLSCKWKKKLRVHHHYTDFEVYGFGCIYDSRINIRIGNVYHFPWSSTCDDHCLWKVILWLYIKNVL